MYHKVYIKSYSKIVKTEGLENYIFGAKSSFKICRFVDKKVRKCILKNLKLDGVMLMPIGI
jgi:hypothetical protein